MSARDLKTSLVYGVDDKTRHWQYFSPTPRTDAQKAAHPLRKQDRGGATKLVETTIHDARYHMPNAKLDECSFELSQGWKPSLVNVDYYKLHEDASLKTKLYTEVADYLKKYLGAAHVHVMHHQVRNESKNGGSFHGAVAGYAVAEPHTDSSPLGGDEAYLGVADVIPEFQKYAGKGRFMYLNMWRNISDSSPVQNNHLAVLDERTVVKPDDYILKDLFMSYEGSDGMHIPQYRINARHHSLHKWYYFPLMKNDEALLFKQADSDYTKESRMCFHVAVPDSSVPKDAQSRESIELRCIAIFPDAPSGDTVPTKELISQEQINTNGGMPEGASSSSSSLPQWVFAPFSSLLAYLFAPKDYGENEDAIPRYMQGLLGGVNYFDKWPQEGKSYVAGLCVGVEEDVGIKAVASILAADSTGHFQLKHKSGPFKEKVVEACCADEDFREAVRKHIISTLSK